MMKSCYCYGCFRSMSNDVKHSFYLYYDIESSFEYLCLVFKCTLYIEIEYVRGSKPPGPDPSSPSAFPGFLPTIIPPTV